MTYTPTTCPRCGIDVNYKDCIGCPWVDCPAWCLGKTPISSHDEQLDHDEDRNGDYR
jgi:hypothetical protein